MLAFVKSILQENCLKCCTSIKMLAAHKCVHPRGYHTFWMVSVATLTLQSWPHTITWACKKQPARTLWHQWQATAECHAPVSAEGGRATVTGWNTCFYSKLEEDYQLRWRLHCEICLQKCCGEVTMNFTYVTCKQHTIKTGVLTFWLPLTENITVCCLCAHIKGITWAEGVWKHCWGRCLDVWGRK